MNQKIYCGSGKKGRYSIKLNIEIDKIPSEWITEKNGKRYINLELSERKTPDQYGKTHSITVDTWRKPEQQEAQGASQKQDDSNDLPW
jgi:hypothetical protein